MKKEQSNSDEYVRFLPIVHQALSPLTSAFPRVTGFLYFCLIIFGMIMRSDTYEVTAFIRALGLHKSSYQNLINHFEGVPVCLDKLVELWCMSVFTMLGPLVYRVEGRPVLVGDSTKQHKRDRPPLPRQTPEPARSCSTTCPLRAGDLLSSLRGYGVRHRWLYRQRGYPSK